MQELLTVASEKILVAPVATSVATDTTFDYKVRGREREGEIGQSRDQEQRKSDPPFFLSPCSNVPSVFSSWGTHRDVSEYAGNVADWKPIYEGTRIVRPREEWAFCVIQPLLVIPLYSPTPPIWGLALAPPLSRTGINPATRVLDTENFMFVEKEMRVLKKSREKKQEIGRRDWKKLQERKDVVILCWRGDFFYTHFPSTQPKSCRVRFPSLSFEPSDQVTQPPTVNSIKGSYFRDFDVRREDFVWVPCSKRWRYP